MTNRSRVAAIALAAAVGLGGGIYLGVSRGPATSEVEAQAIETLYATRLADLSGRPQALSQWKDKILVINFWATWCPPCREEIPGLIRVQRKYSAKNLQIVGIALDSPDQVAAFANSVGINYPVLLGGLDAINLTRLLGDASGGLPFTIVISAKGGANRTHLGMLSEAQLELLIAESSVPGRL
jgi:thiol-disulfide isomerase/thioredoxin